MYKRPVMTDISQSERLVDATFSGGEPEQQRQEDEIARARFDEAIEAKAGPSLVERLRRWARRRTSRTR